MVILWLWSCLIVGLCSATCKQENIIFTGDHKSFWVAEINGVSTPQALAPKKIPIFIERGVEEITVTFRKTCGDAELLAISLETKNIQRIDVLGQTKTVPDGNVHWVKSSFQFGGKPVDEITVRVKTCDHPPKAALRSIYVRACVVEGPKTLEEEIEKVLNDLVGDVQSLEFDKIRKLYYTNEVVQVIQGDKVSIGKAAIEERLRRIIPRPAFWKIKFFDSGELSETRVYTALETIYFKDKAMRTKPIAVYRLSLLWEKQGNRWKIDQIALTDDGSKCGPLTVKNPPH